ncbi:uncharacterized protein LOC120258933 [Dioscorea cayenensis subsp. rotundata]|uniref:Uncharacterized protein LOC120258933 n=1 Tax=Dioscorea cayennensis subsp. rotundata TaxID=55577 RepID=A0AB40B7L9_DIOCR|nr:uncharacterized protein LOC120258933 [Dioscorea cayenensis subsp. rotundata]
MAAAAKRLVISSKIATKSGFVEVSNVTHGSKFRCFGTASAASGVLKEEKESKKISKLERRAMLEAFVDQYRASNAGRFPTVSLAQKQIGGSYYHVRQMIQELEFNYRMSLAGKNKAQVGKTEQGSNPALLWKEVPGTSEIEEVSKPAVSASCVSSKDIDTGSDIRAENNTIVDLIIDDVLLDTKEPSVSSAVETASVKKVVKQAHSPSRKKIVECTKNSSINGVSSFGTQMRTDESSINRVFGLTSESMRHSDQGSNPALLLKEGPGPSEIEEISKPVASASCVSYEDFDTLSKIGSKDGATVDLVIDDEFLDRKEPSVSSTVETASVKKAAKHARSSSRKKIVECTKNSSINGVSSSGTQMRTDESRIDSVAELASESLQHSDHDSKRDEANSSESSRSEATVHILNSPHLDSEENNKELKSTEHLCDRNEPKRIDQIGSLEAPEPEELIGDTPKKVEIRESSPGRSDIWGNLKALANSFVNFWWK